MSPDPLSSKHLRWTILVVLVSVGLAAWWFRPRPEIDALLTEAKAAIDQGDSDLAIRVLDEILDRDPRNGPALLYRGQLAHEQGHSTEAMAHWRRIPDRPFSIGGTARFCEGTLLLGEKKTRQGEQLLLRATVLNPKFLQPYERLVELYVAQMRRKDLRKEVKEEKTGVSMADCLHRNTYFIEICKVCGDSWKKYKEK